ncbi:MAG: DUF721 domain-containing protein [bacterium]
MREHKRKSGKNFDSPRPISGVIGKVLSGLGLKKRYDGWMVVEHWDEIVGTTIAHQARALRYEDGVLFVAVPDDSWRQQLSLQVEEILRQVRTYPFGGAIERIRLQKGSRR